MLSSASGQDKPNRVLRLATRAGKIELFCALGNTRRVPKETLGRKPFNKSSADQVCSVKMAGYWSSFFLRVYGPRRSRGP